MSINKDITRFAAAPRLIVGIGASAGGLDACERLFAEIPGDNEIAIVLVMHMSASQKSHLRELLGHVSAVRFEPARDQARLESGCVYVIEPGEFLQIRNARLHVSPREEHGEREVIDRFFSSLAADQKARAVGVILSGSGHDGARGLAEIGAAGGLCIAQAPESAEFESMPQSAIETGVVHRVLEPGQIWSAIQAYQGDSNQLEPPLTPSSMSADTEPEEDEPDQDEPDQDEPEDDEPENDEPEDDEPENDEPEDDETRPTSLGREEDKAFERVLARLGEPYGVDFLHSYKRGTLRRRAERRMSLNNLPNWSAYLAYLQDEPEEITALYQDVLIGVTEFFRDPPLWEFVSQQVIPQLLSRREDGERPLRVWVPGCASGEEVYSLAICILEQLQEGEQPANVQIFATDIAPKALNAVRRGVYGAHIQRNISSQRLDRFFSRSGDQFKILPEVRDLVTVAPHNLLTDPPFSHLDLISCRNLLIYLNASAQRQVLDTFHFCAKPGGILILGGSESIGRHAEFFEPVSEKLRIFRSIASEDPARRPRAHWSANRSYLPLTREVAARRPRETSTQERAEKLILTRYVRACVTVNDSMEITSFFGPTADYLDPPTGEARMALVAWAKPGIYPRLRPVLQQVFETRQAACVDDILIERDGTTVRIECSVEPVDPLSTKARLVLISFRDMPRAVDAVAAEPDAQVIELQTELRHAHEELQDSVRQIERINEDYMANHEQFLSLNEELQSNNEELEVSQEELQSLNEELTTINRQLEEKNHELRRANADIRNLLTSTNLPLIFLDAELNIHRFTPAVTDLMRLRPTDVGRSIEHIKLRFEDRELLAEAKNVLQGGAPGTHEVETDDGSIYSVQLFPYRTEGEDITGVSIVFHDITEQKRAAQRVDEARVYAESIVETVRTSLIILDRQFRITSANRHFYETFGLAPADVQGRRLFEIEGGQWNAPYLKELLEKVLPRDEEIYDFKFEHHTTQWGRRIFRLNGRLMSRQDQPALILLSLEDYTAREHAERRAETRAHELLEEQRQKDEFLAMLGHELRNPLSAIVYSMELLQPRPEDPERIKQGHAVITRQVERIRSMLDQLLDVARLQTGKITFKREPVDLAEAARNALEAVKPLVAQHQHAVSVSVPPDAEAMVCGDLGRLTQVVENLLSNAAKYTDSKGKIDLVISLDDREVQLRVQDNGMGIDAELLPRIFDLFAQDTRALNRARGGIGLGLSLTRHIVEVHGGRIEALSGGVGQGSKFIVHLPRLHPDGAALAAETRGPEAPNQTAHAAESAARRVLFVDDEKDITFVLTSIVAQKGHQTFAAHDGPAALKALAEREFDIAFIDLGLPDMDGYQLARRIRDDYPDTPIVLVALTGYRADAERLEKAGFDHHLLKPPDTAAILELIADVALRRS